MLLETTSGMAKVQTELGMLLDGPRIVDLFMPSRAVPSARNVLNVLYVLYRLVDRSVQFCLRISTASS